MTARRAGLTVIRAAMRTAGPAENRTAMRTARRTETRTAARRAGLFVQTGAGSMRRGGNP